MRGGEGDVGGIEEVERMTGRWHVQVRILGIRIQRLRLRHLVLSTVATAGFPQSRDGETAEDLVLVACNDHDGVGVILGDAIDEQGTDSFARRHGAHTGVVEVDELCVILALVVREQERGAPCLVAHGQISEVELAEPRTDERCGKQEGCYDDSRNRRLQKP